MYPYYVAYILIYDAYPQSRVLQDVDVLQAVSHPGTLHSESISKKKSTNKHEAREEML